MIRLEMKNYNVKLTKKLPEYQHYHKGNIDKYKYITGEEILLLPSDESRMIEPARFTYSSLERVLETQTKTIEDQNKKQVAVATLKFLKSVEQKFWVKDALPQDQLNEEAKNVYLNIYIYIYIYIYTNK